MCFVSHVFMMWHMKHAWIMIFSFSIFLTRSRLLALYIFCWTLCSGLNHALNLASFLIYTKVFALNQKKERWFFSSRIMETKCIQRRKIQMDCANNAFFLSIREREIIVQSFERAFNCCWTIDGKNMVTQRIVQIGWRREWVKALKTDK